MSPKEPTTPKTTPKKRSLQRSSALPNQETRFLWVCLKSTGLKINYDEVARVCGCTKNAARLRFYKIRDLFQDMDLFEDEDESNDTHKSKKRAPSRTPKKEKTESKDHIKELSEDTAVKLKDVLQDSELEAEDLYEA